MPPRRRAQFTQESIDQQLQQIHLLDPSSTTENLEQLAPIIRQIHQNRQQEAYLRTLKGLVESKDAEIEKICGDNYEDFVSSVNTLFSIRSYITKLRQEITSLDQSVDQVGKGVVEKKRALLQSKKTAANLDEAIDTLQACLRVLDVVDRVGDMVREGKYWSALRSLEDIQSMPSSSLSQTPFYQHLLSSLPSLRAQIKDAVTASMKQWLLEIRNISGQVGELALEAMEARAKKWRVRREKDPMLRNSRVGSAVEMISYEKTEFDPLDNDKVTVDFRPLYQCIHIYTALESIDELRKSYQADRKIQSELILPAPLPLSQLTAVAQEVVGFFIVETYVLRNTGDFRSQRDVEELWDALLGRLSAAITYSLKLESGAESYMAVKETLIAFVTTLETYAYSANSLHSFISVLFEKYAQLLEKQFSRSLEEIINSDDQMPMQVEKAEDRDTVLASVWITQAERNELTRAALPLSLPWSQAFYQSCQSIESFVQKFYQFVEGVSQNFRNIDENFGKSLDTLLITNVGRGIENRLPTTATLPQLGQVITNLEHFEIACAELERVLANNVSAHRGGSVRLTAASAFSAVRTKALARVNTLITSKLDGIFELSEYDPTPTSREDGPSMYLYEIVNWLTTVVDLQLVIQEQYKDEAYRAAASHVAESLIDFLVGRNTPAVNENAISNILVDVEFLDEQFQQIGRPHLSSVFAELRLVTSIVLQDTVADYLIPANRQASYAAVKPRRLQGLLDKLAKYGLSCRDAPSREKGEKRRKQADQVGRLYPG